METSKKLHRPDLFLRNRAKVVFRSPHSLSKKLYMKKGKGYAGPKSTFGTPHLLAKNFRCGEQGKVVFRSPYSLSKKLYVDKGKGYVGAKSTFYHHTPPFA